MRARPGLAAVLSTHFTVMVSASLLLAGVSQAQGIAGLQPSMRPADAPVITDMKKDGPWYAQALRGVEQPYPASLRFLEDQGAWFSPFMHPGMTGPYDIRGWHQPATPSNQ